MIAIAMVSEVIAGQTPKARCIEDVRYRTLQSNLKTTPFGDLHVSNCLKVRKAFVGGWRQHEGMSEMQAPPVHLKCRETSLTHKAYLGHIESLAFSIHRASAPCLALVDLQGLY